MQCTVQGAPDSVGRTSISSMTRWQTCDADFPCALGGGLYLKHLTSSGMSDSVCMIWTSCARDITMRSAQAEQSQAVVCAGLSVLPRDLQAGDLNFLLEPQSTCLHECQGTLALKWISPAASAACAIHCQAPCHRCMEPVMAATHSIEPDDLRIAALVDEGLDGHVLGPV